MTELNTKRPATAELNREGDLNRIERHARHAMNSAVSITGAVRILRAQPAFETRAQDQLRCAEAELEAALNAVRNAMQEFSTKPVTA